MRSHILFTPSQCTVPHFRPLAPVNTGSERQVHYQGRSQKKIERGPNFATFYVTAFTYNGILPFV